MGELLASVHHAGEWLRGGRQAAGAETAQWQQSGRQGGGYLLPEQELLAGYAEAFYGLAKLFQEMPCQKERLSDADMEGLFGNVREQVCIGCSRMEECWERNYFTCCQVMYELLRELECEGTVSESLRERLARQCEWPEAVEQALHESYGQARTSLMWSNRMMEQRMAAGEQIFQTAGLLKRMSEGFAGAPQQEARIRKRLKKELHLAGIEADHIRVFPGGGERLELYLSLRSEGKICLSSAAAAEIISDCVREKMRPAWNCRAAVCREPANFHFVPDTRYQMLCGISRITKSGEMVSGDNFAFMQKDTGKAVMSLADGMGSGAGACRESQKVIELLEQFLEAGFPQETAVRMINSCMLLQNQNQMFSTIDLCMIDLYNAKCDMIKSGAAPTFIRTGNEIEVIAANAFPVGIIQQSDYESMHRRLQSGSSVIMMTDGVLDALPEEGREQQMVELIARTASRNAQEYARRLMEKVYLLQSLKARDDMTILVGNIYEK